MGTILTTSKMKSFIICMFGMILMVNAMDYPLGDDCYDAFNELDFDHSGFITYEEGMEGARNLMKTQGRDVAVEFEERVKKLFYKDNDGVVTYPEWRENDMC